MYKLVIMTVIVMLPAISFSDTIVLEQPSDDVYVFSGMPTTNYNFNDFFCHGYYENTHDGYMYTLVMWDIYALPPDIIVDSAIMKLYCDDFEGSPSGSPRYYIVTEYWDEGTVTWNTKPDYSISIQAGSTWPSAGSWHEVDVTEFVQNWYNGSYTNYGIYGVTMGTSNHGYAVYRSKEYSSIAYHPKLVVTFTYTALQPTTWGQIKTIF